MQDLPTRAFTVAILLALSAGCDGASTPVATASAVVDKAPAKPPQKPALPSESADPFAADEPFDCGGLECKAYDTADAAFSAILEEKPLILAVGETHAQKGSEGIQSVTARFTDGMLPMLKDKASALVLELWVAEGKCGKEKEKQVAEKQKEIVKDQAKNDQNEFVTLGEKSRAAGVVPFILRPTCEEYDKIQKAGDDAVFEMLTMITSNMQAKATKLFDENKKKSPEKMIVTYGGAMHNDLAPKEGREQWSFAKSLDDLSNHKYVELDLVVPEYVGTTKAWQDMPWYKAFQKSASCEGAQKARKKTIVYTTSPRAYALIFPCSK